MTLLAPTPLATTTRADRQATGNWQANLAPLKSTQPQLADMLANISHDLTWVFGRDGSLTAMDAAGQWWANCSLPVSAAHALLKSLESNNQTSCFLSPAHAGLMQAARQRMGTGPALFAIIPELQTLRVILSCHDFSADIRSHHLWFAAGELWPDQLRLLFENNPGLPTPSRFIKTKLTPDESLEPMISESQRIFAAVLNERSQALDSIRAAWSSTPKRTATLLIAGSNFRLWDDCGDVLRNATASLPEMALFDSDDPASASPLALASAAQNCTTIIAANISRADTPNIIPPHVRWITWLTQPHVLPFNSVAPSDVLIVADPQWKSSALSAGWPSSQIAIASWPTIEPAPISTQKPTLAIIADTRPVEIPRAVEDLSSHRILWESIEAELHDDPLSLEQLDNYLDQRSRRFNIKPEAIDRRAFVENLIVPAYQQGLARLLLGAGLPLRLHGSGWQELPEFHSVLAGPLTNRQSLQSAAAAATALIYVWPARYVHAIDFLGRPVISRAGRRPEAFIRQAKIALISHPAPSSPHPTSLPAAIESFLPNSI